MRTRRALAAFTVALGGLGAGLLLPDTATAVATTDTASGCVRSGPVRDSGASGPVTTSYCVTYQGGDVVDNQGNAGRRVVTGHLNKGRNWFVCQARSNVPNPRVGSATNNYWLLTLADKPYSNGGWGWIPATLITVDTSGKPVPGVPICSAKVRRLNGTGTDSGPATTLQRPRTPDVKTKTVPKPASPATPLTPTPITMNPPAPVRPPWMPPPPPPEPQPPDSEFLRAIAGLRRPVLGPTVPPARGSAK